MPYMPIKFDMFDLQPSDDHPGSHIDFAKKRLQLGESLYFKVLENIMVNEKKKTDSKNVKPDFSVSDSSIECMCNGEFSLRCSCPATLQQNLFTLAILFSGVNER